jgi:hypothetical protein
VLPARSDGDPLYDRSPLPEEIGRHPVEKLLASA